MKNVLALLALLGLVNAASAHISVNVAGTDVGGGLIAYTVSLVSDNGQNVTAFDGGFFGAMNQNKIMNVFDTPLLDFSGKAITNYGVNAATDSHFLFTNSQLFIQTAPAETPSSLTGIFGIAPARHGGISTTNLALAQIVLPPGASVLLYGSASDALGNKTFFFPEPTTFGLLAIGVAGLLRRKLA